MNRILRDRIEELDLLLLNHFRDKFIVDSTLNRRLVSYQANKKIPKYRWFKYKEAFSASLVKLLFNKYSIASGEILDPFAGSGTALFVSSDLGIDADGIELLPVGQKIIETRNCLEQKFISDDFEILKSWIKDFPWKNTTTNRSTLSEVRITKGAYPPKTLESIEMCLGALQKENNKIQTVLLFALMCILESISYTRKDGQYLRWDHRSGRSLGKKKFQKREIIDFDRAITAKIKEIISDMTQKFLKDNEKGEISLFSGSCLDILPTFKENTYDCIMTSPPYLNRYDYTRTYALELALLGFEHNDFINLRQKMLSCTVENREKDLLEINPAWSKAIKAVDNQELLQSILAYLENLKIQKKLNNTGIPRMIKGYFYEMGCVINDCGRVLKKGSPLFMVNDNVMYAGVGIPLDTILSNIAEKLSFQVENILELPNGKGNSSQQMGIYGREPLRKCVYVWRKK